MNDAIALNPPMFSERIRENKVNVTNQLIKELDKAKVDILKKALDSRKINYKNEITDFLELTEYLKKSLSSKEYEDIKILITNINQKVDVVLKDLISGSTTAFSKFLRGGYESLIKPMAESTVVSLAGRTALILAPTLSLKIGAGAALGGYTTYKLIKGNKYKKIVNKNYELNKILEGFEIKTDKDGTICDTRFSEEIQEGIRLFLKNNKVSFYDTGYLSLRETIYNLDIPLKEKLCRILNKINGKKINIDKRLEKCQENIFQKINNKVVKPVIGTTSIGASVATSINAINPAILSAPLSTAVVGGLVSKLSESTVIKFLSSGAVALLTSFGQGIPHIGNSINKFLTTENIAVSIAIGAMVGVGSVATKSVISVIKNLKDKFKTNKMRKQIIELDAKLYEKDNAKEITLINQKLLEEVSLEEKAIVAIVCQYLSENNVYCESIPSNINELKNIIKGLDTKNKIKAIRLLYTLIDYNKKEKLSFKKAVLKYGKMCLITLLCGAASLSVYDILTGGGFLNNLVLKGVPEKLPTIDESALPISNKLKINQSNSPTKLEPPTVTSAPAPNPSVPTPAPTPNPSTIPVVKNSIDSKHEIIMEYVAKFNTNPEAFVNSLKTMNPDGMFDEITKLSLDNVIKECVNYLEPKELKKLIDYLNSLPSLDKTTGEYESLVNSLIARINSINSDIEKQIANKLKFANFSRKVGDVSIPAVGLSDLKAYHLKEGKETEKSIKMH